MSGPPPPEELDEPTAVLPWKGRDGTADPAPDTAAPDAPPPEAADLLGLAALDEAEEARTWFDARLRAFAGALSHDRAGRPRTEVERHALGRAARDMIERLAGADTAAAWPGQATLQPGQLLANTYYVRALIARGGVGEIYRVRHRDLRTEHAVKILQPRHALDPVLAAMLLDEARHLLRIQHGGVVACHGLIRDDDGRLLLVMEFVRGTTLAARLRQGPLSAAEMSALATTLLGTLAHLHGLGLVHADLSPDNIMLAEDSCAAPKLIDFGLARLTSGPAGMAGNDAPPLVDFAGKLSWVSPEQLAGGDAPVDGRADLYSLGLVLAAAARGERMEMGQDQAGAIAARSTVPALDGVPPPWDGAIRQMLAPRPEDRPGSAAAALALLGPRGPARERGWFSRRRG